ncbi:MATE family efflux transporter [Alterinioella nitratireducens]|uniref:MATE family efflux transporter n=1 Tax=Alterinioella nitratireducens TaxID=2735915 RepID=UPI004058C6EB
MKRFSDHLRETWALSLPLVGSHLAQISIGLTDTVMMGWYGVSELAAVALASTFFVVIFLLGSGFAKAVMPLVAAATSNGDAIQVRRATRMGIWISTLFALLTLPFFWFSGPVFLFLGQEVQLSANGQDYLRITGWSMPAALLVMVLGSHLSALGRARVLLWVTLAGAVVNAGVNWVFIFGNLGMPELGVRGAALASITTHGAMALLLALYAGFGRGMRGYALFARIWRADPEAFTQVFRLGWPIGLTMLAEVGLFAATSVMMGWIGERELAAHSIALQISSITFMVHIGISSAATVRAGHAWGRRDTYALRQGAFACLFLSGVMVALTILAFLWLPGPMIRLFIDPRDPALPQILAIATGLLAMAALFQLADAAQVVALGLLRGVQDTRVPMIQAVLAYWVVGLPAAYILGFPLGMAGQGIWLGLAIGLSFAGLMMMTRFWRGPAAFA